MLWGMVACPFSTAQLSVIDSLKKEIGLAQTDSSRIHALKNLSWHYLNSRSNMPLAKIYIDSVHALSSAIDNRLGIAIADYQYGVLERQKGNYGKALSYFENYVQFGKASGEDKRIADGLYQKALVLDDQGEFEKATDIYYEILKIYESKNDRYGVAFTLNGLGEEFKKSDKPDLAMEHYEKALKIFIDLDEKGDMANVYYNIGGIHKIRKNYKEALEYLNKALQLDQELGSTWGMAYDYEAIGEVYSEQNEHLAALQVHLKALEIRQGLQQKKELAESHTHVGTDYLHLKKYSKAQFHLEKAQLLAEEIGAKKAMQDVYGKRAQVFSATGDYKNALLYTNKYTAVKDSLFNEIKSRQLQELQIKFDTEKKQDAIANLQKDAEIKDLLLERQRSIRNVIIALALGLLFLGVFLFTRYRRRQKERREADERQRLIDIERQKTQIEKQRVEELRRLDRLKDEFLANTSHELRTPLNGIIGLTESLKDGVAGSLNAEVRENLELIASSGKRLSHLVNDILDFSKLKNKDIVLSKGAVDLHSTADVVVRLSHTLIENKKLKLINSIPKHLPLIEADENRLQQILYNLIGNAIKFTEKGYISLFAEEKAGQIHISVTDTGIGILPNKLSGIFNSFEQADGSTAREYGGTGLGLSVTKQLVELHGGTIAVSSKVGKGSIFTVVLPIGNAKATRDKEIPENQALPAVMNSNRQLKVKPAAPSKTSDNTSPKKYTILIVDDEPVNRRVLENHLSVAGYGVYEVSNGKEALHALADDADVAFDLVLLDIMMPGLSGFEVCQKIRETHEASALPIIMLTAKNGVNDLVEGFNSGANDYLTKPFSKNELLSRIKTHLRLNSIHKATSKFVPIKFIQAVGRESITDVVLGDFIEKNVTVVFTDVRDYTPLAERMTPEQNFKFVNAYVGRMGPIIQQNQGFVNQYLGDGIMALFPHESEHALDAAIEMQRTLAIYNKRRIKKGYLPLSVGMGLHTGPLVMGIIGDINRNDTAIISDTVNSASRVEGVTKHYGANIIISEDSLQTIKNPSDFNFRYLGKVKVKGKEEALGIYECFDGDSSDQIALKIQTLNTFKKGTDHMFSNAFSLASDAFKTVLDTNPQDKVAQYFSQQAEEYLRLGLPEDWGVAHTMSEK